MQMLTQHPVNDVRGRIINISSQHGMVACPGDFPYSISKGAIVQMTRTLALELAGDRITVNSVAPDAILTDRMRQLAGSEENLGQMAERTPMRRFGTPEEFAAACVFLCSRQAAFISGQTLGVDGGSLLGVH
jgi:NAD(P)-dependent dehydrogenase (short-subunit alcohol dehydrogenase family)